MRLSQVEVEGFRAFGARVQFDMAGDVVVLVGPNGVGKTSFFDALVWGLFGQIKRLPATRDAVGQDYVRNQFFPTREPLVTLFLADGDNASVIRRTERSIVVAETDREMRGPEADSWVRRLVLPVGESTSTAPVDAFERTFLLGQERIVDFVRDTIPRDRFDSLSTLLGADVVRQFYTKVGVWRRTVATAANSADADVARADRAGEALRLQKLSYEARASRAAAPTVERLKSALASLSGPAAEIGLVSGNAAPADLEALIAQLDDLVGQARHAIERAAAGETEADRLAALKPEIDRLDARLEELAGAQRTSAASLRTAGDRAKQIEARLGALEQERLRVNAQLEKDQQDRLQLATFLTNARTHVTGETCPVCGQPIITADVLHRLDGLLKEIPSGERDLAASLSELDARRANLDRERGEVAREFRTARTTNSQLVSEISAVKTELGTWKADLRELSASWGGRALSAIKPAASSERSRASRLLVQLEDLKDQADTLLARQNLESLDTSGLKLDEERASATRRQAFVRNAADVLDKVASDAKALEISVVQESIARHLPLLQAVYRRLNPHPLFETLEVRFGSFAERGEVYYRVAAGQASGNASMLFSTAQLNAVAVSVFVSLNLLRPAGGLNLLLLDDPVQNMDDYNVLGLVDLLRSLRPHRQLIISTHDASIGDLIRRKLRPRIEGQRTIVHRFLSSDETGPHVLTAVDEYTHPARLLPASG